MFAPSRSTDPTTQLASIAPTSPVTGSRRISTSSPSNRNSAGRRTAWLPPVVNSFALDTPDRYFGARD
jgi:hypothetical protein